jgi:hypothetical protein
MQGYRQCAPCSLSCCTAILFNQINPWAWRLVPPVLVHPPRVMSSPPLPDAVPDDEGRFLVAVTFRIGRFGVPVITEFISPGPRTIVMRIVDGEGSGSLVETHATPLGPDRDRRPLTAVLEAVIAHPDPTGYRAFDAPLP